MNDPDFIYTKQLAKSEIRVGDDIVKLRKWQAGSQNMRENLVDGGAVILKSSNGTPIQIKNISEKGDYWIGLSVPENKQVLMPKFLMDPETNSLMARGRNFTKFKRNVRKNLSFIKKFNKETKAIDVDQKFKAKYKYANYFMKYNLSQEAVKKLDYTTLEKISDNVYLRALGDDNAEVLFTNDLISEEEQVLQDSALEDAISNDEEFDFNSISDNDMDF